MPTYVFTTCKELTAEQRIKLVESITIIHSVEANAPRYFVQVIFLKAEAGSIFVGGALASPDHIWVRADIRSGRTKEQKANILRRIMRETSDLLYIPEENIWVYVFDIPAEGVAEFGNILPPPGGEEEWFAALPGNLRSRLTALARVPQE
jgi:phenylpyruvate tautomerase PptA (4-oxalocrotonate tautomerase family)